MAGKVNPAPEDNVGHPSSTKVQGRDTQKARHCPCRRLRAIRRPGGPLTGPRTIVAGLVADLGFHPVDAGGLRVARLLEPYGMLWTHMALDRKAGRDNAFAYLARSGGSAG